MRRFKRILQADILKVKRTPFLLLHLIIPLLGIVIFFSYQQWTNHQANRLTINFFQILALIYPILAAWLTTIVADQEIEAGDGFFLLSSPVKFLALSSKMVLLVIFGLLSCLFVGAGYHLILSQFRSDYSLSLALILLLVGIVWCCALFQYFFHLWLGLCFGRNVNFSVAAVELLLSALLLTGLGETIWFLFPCAWGLRMVPLLAAYLENNSVDVLTKIQLGELSMVLLTLMMFGFLSIWFSQWEGRKNEL
ncbi:lantibiotic immunity ABC transporter MutG family permease subunit [Enterococcus sp. AZ196]|uniref:lantibiotic immunity ABC transporter MutG family permease subunit n=1 Tax=Enterococcus sp. AZ196 TaxID=2774659 RepID=UPI003D282666